MYVCADSYLWLVVEELESDCGFNNSVSAYFSKAFWVHCGLQGCGWGSWGGKTARCKGTWLRLPRQGEVNQVTHSQKEEMIGWHWGFVGCQGEVKVSQGVRSRSGHPLQGRGSRWQFSFPRVSRRGQVTHVEVTESSPAPPRPPEDLCTFPVLPLCPHSTCLVSTCLAEVNRDEPRTDPPEMTLPLLPPQKKSKNA